MVNYYAFYVVVVIGDLSSEITSRVITLLGKEETSKKKKKNKEKNQFQEAWNKTSYDERSFRDEFFPLAALSSLFISLLPTTRKQTAPMESSYSRLEHADRQFVRYFSSLRPKSMTAIQISSFMLKVPSQIDKIKQISKVAS